MKSVLVLTDFSAAAMRAAESALAIAAKFGADILLLNVYPITPYLPPAGLTLPPQTSAMAKKRESMTRLNRETRRLVKRFQLPESAHRPTIRPISLEGQLADRVPELAHRRKSILVLMGVSGRSYGDLLFDGEVKAVIRQISCPVLVTPEDMTVLSIRRVLFATDLEPADEQVIAELVAFCDSLKAKLNIGHVSRPVLIPDFAEELRASAFTDRIMNLYPGIGCSNPRGSNIMGALQKLSTEKQADVIALRYRKHPFWCRLFHENPLKEAIQHGKTPLLIFPENTKYHD